MYKLANIAFSLNRTVRETLEIFPPGTRSVSSLPPADLLAGRREMGDGAFMVSSGSSPLLQHAVFGVPKSNRALKSQEGFIGWRDSENVDAMRCIVPATEIFITLSSGEEFCMSAPHRGVVGLAAQFTDTSYSEPDHRFRLLTNSSGPDLKRLSDVQPWWIAPEDMRHWLNLTRWSHEHARLAVQAPVATTWIRVTA